MSDIDGPALYQHCCTIWQAMADEADAATLGGVSTLVYTGFLTQLFRKNLLAVPYYSSVMSALKEMGCVEQTKRGGGSATSEWLILAKPDMNRWKNKAAPGKWKEARKGSDAQIRQMLTDCALRLTDAENKIKRLESIVYADLGRSEEMSQMLDGGGADEIDLRATAFQDLDIDVPE